MPQSATLQHSLQTPLQHLPASPSHAPPSAMGASTHVPPAQTGRVQESPSGTAGVHVVPSIDP
jgi:hypothetical protein